MKNFLGALLVVCFSFSAAAQSIPKVYQLPKLKTDADRVKLLMLIQQEFPVFLENMDDYGFEVLEVLADQYKLQAELLEDPEYARLLNQRGPMLQLHVFDENQRIEKVKAIDQDRFRARKKYLEKIFTNKGEVTSLINQTLKDIGKEKSISLLSGVIKAIDPELRAIAYKKPSFQDKLDYLRSLKTDENLDSLVNRAEELFELEKKLIALAEIGVYLGEDKNSLEEYGEKFFNSFKDFEHYTSKRFEVINKNLDNVEKDVVLSRSIIKEISKVHASLFSTDSVEVVSEKKSELFLRELRPMAAVFRGCSGGDCSTSHSFGSPNSPTERVFQVLDKNLKNKGYVQLSKVEINEKAAIYVSSINGPRISTKDVYSILQALYKARKKFDAEFVFIPTKGNIDGLVNYENIEVVLKKLAKKNKASKIKFLDESLRLIIEKFKSEYIDSYYDSMKNNKKGVPYEPNQKDMKKLRVSVSEVNYKLFKFDEVALNRENLLKFLLSVNEFENLKSLKKAVLDLLSVSQTQFKDFTILLRNPNNDSVSEFTESIEYAVEETFKVKNVKMAKKHLLEGIIKSPDAFDEINYVETINLGLENLPYESFLKLVEAVRKEKDYSSLNSELWFFIKSIKSSRMLTIDYIDSGILSILIKLAVFNQDSVELKRELIKRLITDLKNGELILDSCNILDNSIKQLIEYINTFEAQEAERVELTEVAFNHSHWRLRENFAVSLAHGFKGKIKFEFFKQGLMDDDSNVVRTTTENLVSYEEGADKNKLIKLAMKYEHWGARLVAFKEVEKIKDSKVRQDLIKVGLKDEDKLVKQKAKEYKKLEKRRNCDSNLSS